MRLSAQSRIGTPWNTPFPKQYSTATALIWISYAMLAVAMYFSLSSAFEYVNEARRISKEP